MTVEATNRSRIESVDVVRGVPVARRAQAAAQ